MKLFYLIPYSLVFVSICIGCTRTPEEIFERAVERYNKKQDPESREIIEKRFLSDLKAVEIDNAEEYRAGENAVIVQDGENSIVFTSDGYSEPWSQEIRFAHYTPSTRKLCISDGFSAGFYQFSSDEDTVQHISRIKEIYLTNDDETSIDSLYLDNNTLFYFYKRQIYSINLQTEEKSVVSTHDGKEVALGPPYDKFAFKVFMQANNEYLGATVGDAGRYILYLFDYQQETNILKEKVPSRFFTIKGGDLYYLTGKTGAWAITRFTISTEEKEKIKEFDQLRDIAQSGDKLFYVDADGYHITGIDFILEYDENPMLPITNIINDYLIVTYRNKKYLVSTPLYFNKTEEYQNLVPGFFSQNPGLTADDLE